MVHNSHLFNKVKKFLKNRKDLAVVVEGKKIHVVSEPPSKWLVRWCQGQIYIVYDFNEKKISYIYKGSICRINANNLGHSITFGDDTLLRLASVITYAIEDFTYLEGITL